MAYSEKRNEFRPGSMDAVPADDFLNVLLDSSDMWIFVKDENFRILYANKAFLNIYPPERRDKIIGTTTIEDFSEEQAKVFLKEDRKAMELGLSEMIEKITDYKGFVHTIQSKKVGFKDSLGRTMMLGMCTDISEWSDRERALAQSNLALENFAAVAAHDLRSPLGSFLSGIELIRMDKKNSLTDSSLHFLDTMKKSIEGLISQIGSLLSTYHASNSKAIEHADVDVSVLVEEIKFNLAGVIARNEATIRSSSLPVIRSDRHLFRQLLHNLIENSIKYKSDEKPIIILRHEIAAGDHLFSIEDNGLGVRPGYQGNIFKLYEQADRAIDGYGIGLNLCRRIVELHGGRIWIDPNYKTGCRIYFSIPR